ncbi:M15 family metallopeptidase [Rummeliibacillus sp. POC4]|uniref:M15 family metallopeptidase n=1 Tax=Rummeliibacillus sp. POC4 TaxID=2305899 RepID=UPI000E66188A|nr:M15 family metallopeptidase [Rummeliibacillus sp. POC4]RIJ62825.1 D-alanyl-D-alanine carboxypeptidase family protein [Rummeliibacillus sp. POC4]
MKKIIIALMIILFCYQFFINDSPKLNQEISLQDKSPYNGDLILINKDFKLQQEPTNLTIIPKDLTENVLIDLEYKVQQSLIEPLKQMFEAAQEDDIQHFKINSAYRSGKLQQQLYEQKGAEYALPSGSSEHQTGLSIDIGSTQGTMDKTMEGKWLEEHATDYGFILRYPENKVDITGIAFEPWHFRYVGLPHSIIMKQKDMSLEEYIKFLEDEKDYTAKVNGVKYYVQYVENTNQAKIPDSTKHEVSGDNLNGFIITSILK